MILIHVALCQKTICNSNTYEVQVITTKIINSMMILVTFKLYVECSMEVADKGTACNSPGCRLGRTLTVQLLELGEGGHRLSKGGCRGTRQSDNKPHSTLPNRVHIVRSSVTF